MKSPNPCAGRSRACLLHIEALAVYQAHPLHQACAGVMGVTGEPDGAPINGYAEALADPQAGHPQLVQPMVLPNGAATRTVACPVRTDGQVLALDMRPPALGEHTAAVVTGLLAK